MTLTTFSAFPFSRALIWNVRPELPEMRAGTSAVPYTEITPSMPFSEFPIDCSRRPPKMRRSGNVTDVPRALFVLMRPLSSVSDRPANVPPASPTRRTRLPCTR